MCVWINFSIFRQFGHDYHDYRHDYWHNYYDYYDYYVDDYHSIAIVNIRAILRANSQVIVHEASRLPRSLWCVCVVTIKVYVGKVAPSHKVNLKKK